MAVGVPIQVRAHHVCKRTRARTTLEALMHTHSVPDTGLHIKMTLALGAAVGSSIQGRAHHVCTRMRTRTTPEAHMHACKSTHIQMDLAQGIAEKSQVRDVLCCR